MTASLLRRFLNSACRIFTICALLLCLIQLATSTGTSDVETIISPFNFMMIFPFSLCLACAGLVRREAKLSPFSAIFSHFALTTLGACLFIFLPAGVFASARNTLVIVFFYLVIYIIVMLLSAWINSVISHHLDAEERNR